MIDVYAIVGMSLGFMLISYLTTRGAYQREKMIMDHCHEVDKKLIDLCALNAECTAKNKMDLIKLEAKVKELECAIKKNSKGY